MSKNSPVFLQNLIAKVENESDVGRSLTRFLLYHPINEFEPFFESLGLKPSELYPLLPRNLMFLSDDDVLLENYHVLCNYGVPRSKIGKMYKEGTGMFRFGYGILLSKLQAYEKLGLTKPTIIKLVTCCPELLVGDVNVEFLRVLEKLKSLGVKRIGSEDVYQTRALPSNSDWKFLKEFGERVDGTFLQEKTNFLLKLGFVENSVEMAKAQCKFQGRGDQLQERFDCLVNAGLDYHTVSDMVKLVPSIPNQSIDIIEKKIDYLLNHLGYPLESLVAFPTILCYSTGKIKLRFSMYGWLKEQGVVIPTKNRKMVRSTVALSTILACSDARFVKYFVVLHPEGPKNRVTLLQADIACDSFNIKIPVTVGLAKVVVQLLVPWFHDFQWMLDGALYL
ncbi:hypothetical protein COCNU_01G011420 [Cocos nucifera]|uniref:Uncharacterized protein n=1 Tax=Cocos nucifera TaxID=13894 RepID=A0A8K0MV38_COCNU|nr:hypothetical protein COCNU_01G011420 [Cocos nucifera]